MAIKEINGAAISLLHNPKGSEKMQQTIRESLLSRLPVINERISIFGKRLFSLTR
jgi:hypothetical protein